jgi:acyl carrier protein
MTRDEVMSKVRDHLSTELEIDPSRIAPDTRFKEDLDADSLDLYELVMELEDGYGIRVSEQEAARIKTVGDAVDYVVEHAPV